MRFVPVKTEEQQAHGIVFRARDLLVRQRTQCVNALRGHLFEYGYVFPQGINHVASLVTLVEDPRSSLPESVRSILKLLVDTFTALEVQIATLGSEIDRRSKTDPTACRLMTIPGRRADCFDGHNGARAGRTGLRSWARLRGLARADVLAEIHGREAKTRCRIETRRTDHPASADHRGEYRGSARQPTWGSQGILAGADAGSQAEDAGHRRSIANKMVRIIWALLVKGGIYRAPVAAA
jgi:transposase